MNPPPIFAAEDLQLAAGAIRNDLSRREFGRAVILGTHGSPDRIASRNIFEQSEPHSSPCPLLDVQLGTVEP